MHRLRRFLNSLQEIAPEEGGQSLVEFALVGAILLAIVLGGVWGIDLIAEQAAVESIARNAARFAAEHGGHNEDLGAMVRLHLENHGIAREAMTMRVTVYDDVQGMIDGNALDSYVDNLWLEPASGTEGRCRAYGQPVMVEIERDWRFDVPVAGLFIKPFFAGDVIQVRHFDRCWRSGISE